MHTAIFDPGILIEQFLFFITISTVCIIGAYARDTIDSVTQEGDKVKLKPILFSAIVISIVVWGYSDFLIEKLGDFKRLLAISVFLGLASYDITIRLIQWDFVKEILAAVGLKYVKEVEFKQDDEDEDDDEENEEPKG